MPGRRVIPVTLAGQVIGAATQVGDRLDIEVTNPLVVERLQMRRGDELPPPQDADVAVLAASLAEKAGYVVGASQSRQHACHWPDCRVQVLPTQWGCKSHWFKLPKPLRDRIWREYVPGREEGYLTVAREVRAWIEAQRS